MVVVITKMKDMVGVEQCYQMEISTWVVISKAENMVWAFTVIRREMELAMAAIGIWTLKKVLWFSISHANQYYTDEMQVFSFFI